MQLQTLLTDQSHRYNSNRTNGYRTVAGYAQELPEWLAPYAQNACWKRRLANLLEAGYEKELRYFIQTQMTDRVRSTFNYFNKCWSKKSIEGTIQGIRKKITDTPIVEEICKRINATEGQLSAIKGIVNRWGQGAIRHAVRAQEEGRNKFKYFCWLTSAKGQQVMKESV